MSSNLRYLIVLILSISFISNKSLAEDLSLKIGVIAPITGGVASWGISVKSAIELANLHSSQPAELIIADEETCVAKKAVDAFNFLHAVKKIDILITSCLGGAQAIAPLAKKYKLPLFISGRSAKDFHAKNSNALSWLSLLDYEGEAIGRLIAEKKWTNGSAMIWADYFGIQFSTGIKNAILKQKLNFSYKDFEVAPDAVPSASEVQRLIGSKPQVIFLMMPEITSAQVVKQLRTLSYKGEIVLQSSMLQTYNKHARKPFIGALQQKFRVEQKRFNELKAQIAKHQGDDVADDFIFSYDGFQALLTAANLCLKAQSADLEQCLNTELRNEQWRSGASGQFRFMKDGSTERPMVFKTITAIGFK